MSYEVFARKYRPKVWGDLVGQEAIAQTLRYAVAAGRTGSVYLFAGSHGVGKTSVARIMAKALNCPASTEGAPCGTCETCESIARGECLDVVEIDAASNSKVDDVRTLRESVGYKPASCRFKVYILDEVHRLSTSAFDALLKTFEESPPLVRFVLATTELHKVPTTILSRAQVFRFQRAGLEALVRRLRTICDAEKLAVEDAALRTIARRRARVDPRLAEAARPGRGSGGSVGERRGGPGRAPDRLGRRRLSHGRRVGGRRRPLRRGDRRRPRGRSSGRDSRLHSPGRTRRRSGDRPARGAPRGALPQDGGSVVAAPRGRRARARGPRALGRGALRGGVALRASDPPGRADQDARRARAAARARAGARPPGPRARAAPGGRGPRSARAPGEGARARLRCGVGGGARSLARRGARSAGGARSRSRASGRLRRTSRLGPAARLRAARVGSRVGQRGLGSDRRRPGRRGPGRDGPASSLGLRLSGGVPGRAIARRPGLWPVACRRRKAGRVARRRISPAALRLPLRGGAGSRRSPLGDRVVGQRPVERRDREPGRRLAGLGGRRGRSASHGGLGTRARRSLGRADPARAVLRGKDPARVGASLDLARVRARRPDGRRDARAEPGAGRSRGRLALRRRVGQGPRGALGPPRHARRGRSIGRDRSRSRAAFLAVEVRTSDLLWGQLPDQLRAPPRSCARSSAARPSSFASSARATRSRRRLSRPPRGPADRAAGAPARSTTSRSSRTPSACCGSQQIGGGW